MAAAIALLRKVGADVVGRRLHHRAHLPRRPAQARRADDLGAVLRFLIALEEVDEQVGRGRAAVDYKQIGRLRGGEHAIDLAAMFKVDERRFRMETLQCRVLVVAVDRATGDAAIFQILHEVGGEEALSDSAFAVDDEVDLFVHVKVRWFRGCEDRRRVDRECVGVPMEAVKMTIVQAMTVR